MTIQEAKLTERLTRIFSRPPLGEMSFFRSLTQHSFMRKQINQHKVFMTKVSPIFRKALRNRISGSQMVFKFTDSLLKTGLQ